LWRRLTMASCRKRWTRCTVLRIDRRVPYSKPDNFALSTPSRWSPISARSRDHVIVMAVLSSIGLLVAHRRDNSCCIGDERTHEIASARRLARGHDI